MAKYVIRWDAGFGESWEVIDAESHEHAEQEAYFAWRDQVESYADYSAVSGEEASQLIEDHGSDPEEYGLERTDPEAWE